MEARTLHLDFDDLLFQEETHNGQPVRILKDGWIDKSRKLLEANKGVSETRGQAEPNHELRMHAALTLRQPFRLNRRSTPISFAREAVRILQEHYVDVCRVGRSDLRGAILFELGHLYDSMGWSWHTRLYYLLALLADLIELEDDTDLLNRRCGTAVLAPHLGFKIDEIVKLKTSFTENSLGTTPVDHIYPEFFLPVVGSIIRRSGVAIDESESVSVNRLFCEWTTTCDFIRQGNKESHAISFEHECAHHVASVPGWTARFGETGRLGQIDIIVENANPSPLLSSFGPIILCECKSSEEGADLTDIALFEAKLRTSRTNTGIMFCDRVSGDRKEGMEENALRQVLNAYQNGGITILVVRKNDFRSVVVDSDFVDLLRKAYFECILFDRRYIDKRTGK